MDNSDVSVLKVLQRVLSLNAELENALLNLYNAGHWTCDRNVDETALWDDAKKALGLEDGTSPFPIPLDKE